MDHEERLERILTTLSPKTRREFLKQAAALGLGAAAAQTIILREPLVVTAGPSPKRGGTVRVMGHQEVASLSPDDSSPSVHWVMVAQMHNALVELNEYNVLERVLAESYSVTKDGLQYTFKLRRGVKFHDGSELTADDVKYTYEWYMNPANAANFATRFAAVARVETPDKYTVVVRMKEPFAPFLIQTASTYIYSARYHGRIGERAYKSQPMGTGPFKLREWRPAEYTIVEAFDQHFRGRPNIDLFRQDVVPEPSVRAIALRTGTADSATWPLLVEDNLAFEQNPNYTVFRTSSTGVNHFPINNKLPQLSDKRVRQAMMHAIDRQRLIDDVWRGTAILAHSIYPPSMRLWYNRNLKTYAYDPARARTLLEEAGWRMGPGNVRVKDGQRLSFTCAVITGDRARRPLAEIAQQDLAAVGIEMRIVERPVATILEQLPKGQLDASLFNWTYNSGPAEPDPQTTLRTGGVRNFASYSNPRMDELLTQGVREVDIRKRQRIYNEVQQIFVEDVPIIYNMYWDWFNVFSRRIKGLPTKPELAFEIYRNAYKWWIE
ncbi:MAG: ABC transporter substrate-binding protein [Armatimonadota bacterium]|nr:ABC transporter substrate-binding protein [Armatimonadota bacterium]